MKMTLDLLRDPYGMESIEGFSFSEVGNAISDSFETVVSSLSVDIDPLIPEQVVRIDLGSAYSKINYARATPIMSGDYPRQAMDRYPAEWFFYVTAIERKRSSTVVGVHLKLDGMTTLMAAQQSAGESISDLFTAQSYVRREHRGRFLSSDSSYYSQYAIDKIKEGIPVDLKKIAVRSLASYSTYQSTMKWYIVYKAANTWGGSDVSSANALKTYFCPATALKVSDASSSGTGADVYVDLTATTPVASRNYFYINSTDSPGFSFLIAYYTTAGVSQTLTISSSTYFAVEFYVNSVTSTGDYMTIRGFSGSAGNITGITTLISNLRVTAIRWFTASFGYVRSSATTNFDDMRDGSVLTINAGTTTVSAVYSTYFGALDRTDPLLVKIIETPYPPAILSYSSGNYSLTNCTFDAATNMWIPTSNTPWRVALAYNGSTSIALTKSTAKATATASVSDDWDGFDPKLLNSDFYEIKIVYDTYSVTIALEDEDIPSISYTSISGRRLAVYWYISPDINSLFAIKATMYYLADGSLASKTEDFGIWCVVDRNNEKPLFTNAYLNYMRVGYNYDQKAKSLQNWSSVAGIAISAAGMVAGAATGQALLTVGSAAGLISSISSAAFGAASRENSMAAKLAQYKAQGTSVSGSSDVAILDLYSPLVNVIEYYPDDEIASSLAILFHRYGYATNQFKKPDLESRSLWNYIEGDMVIDSSSMTGIPPQVMTRALEQTKEGTTIFHYNNDILDLRQEKENWETDVL